MFFVFSFTEIISACFYVNESILSCLLFAYDFYFIYVFWSDIVLILNILFSRHPLPFSHLSLSHHHFGGWVGDLVQFTSIYFFSVKHQEFFSLPWVTFSPRFHVMFHLFFSFLPTYWPKLWLPFPFSSFSYAKSFHTFYFMTLCK